jgi:hypothetical protein
VVTILCNSMHIVLEKNIMVIDNSFEFSGIQRLLKNNFVMNYHMYLFLFTLDCCRRPFHKTYMFCVRFKFILYPFRLAYVPLLA